MNTEGVASFTDTVASPATIVRVKRPYIRYFKIFNLAGEATVSVKKAAPFAVHHFSSVYLFSPKFIVLFILPRSSLNFDHVTALQINCQIFF